jgi:O-antigen ligase
MFWRITVGGKIQNPVLDGATILAFLIAPFGGMWMFYDTARNESKTWPYIILVVIPYFFLWHYLVRVRKRGHERPAREASSG